MILTEIDPTELTGVDLAIFKIYTAETSVDANRSAPIHAYSTTEVDQRSKGIPARDALPSILLPNLEALTKLERDDHELFCVGQRIRRERCRICLVDILQEVQEDAVAFVNQKVQEEPKAGVSDQIWQDRHEEHYVRLGFLRRKCPLCKAEPGYAEIYGSKGPSQQQKPVKTVKYSVGRISDEKFTTQRPASINIGGNWIYIGGYWTDLEITWAKYATSEFLSLGFPKPQGSLDKERMEVVLSKVVRNLERQGLSHEDDLCPKLQP
jgi:hypothetical protein